jgi:multicomponent Na+:H+ antiporter subunit B
MRVRTIIFLCFAAAFFSFLIWGMLGLSAFGNYPGPYGDILNSVAVSERHVLNVVTAVMFDYRGFDTLGEEFILFAAVTGVTLLLRNDSEENCAPQSKLAQTGPEMIPAQTTDAARFFTLPFIGLIIVFGIYIVLTGRRVSGRRDSFQRVAFNLFRVRLGGAASRKQSFHC